MIKLFKKDIGYLKFEKMSRVDEILPSNPERTLHKAVMFLSCIYLQRMPCLEHVPFCFKVAQIIMMKNPDKPASEVTSLLSSISYIKVVREINPITPETIGWLTFLDTSLSPKPTGNDQSNPQSYIDNQESSKRK